MSAKWRALQHRHQYTYGSTRFPEPFVNALTHLSSDASAYSSAAASKFLSEVERLVSLNTTYAQVAALKDLAASFSELLTDDALPAEFVAAGARLYLEVLFFESSLPLHRTIISAIAKSRKHLPVIDSCFLSLCEEYSDPSRKGKKRFLVSRAALSLLGYPKLGFLNDTIERCAVLAAQDIAYGLSGVLSDVESGFRPSPSIMEQCQEAMSCLYYLLQKFPSRFSGEDRSSSVFRSVFTATVGVLKSQAFSRDCLVAAGVSFWAALLVYISSQDLIFFIAQGLFGFTNKAQEAELGMKMVPYGGDLYSDIRLMSALSRLCLIRGVLTAVPRSLLNTHFHDSSGRVLWTVLYNGILPQLCNYCENPSDSHFNFHALTVTQICFQQIKTSIMSDLTDCSGNYDPFPEDIRNRVLAIIWKNLEDPLNQTVKQVQLIFDIFLDVQTNFLSRESNERNKVFLCKIASDLLLLGPRCKGRYVPLAFLTKRLGAKALLNMNPKLLFETINAYVNDDVCCSATSFLKCFLEQLCHECWSSDGVEMGYEIFRRFCLPPLLQGLVSGLSKLRSNLNTYALPVVLEVDVDSIFPMLACISIGPNVEGINITNTDITLDQCVAVLVSLLKVSRLHALIEGDIDWDHDKSYQNDSYDGVAVVCVKGIYMKVPVKWLILALTHADESIRIDAAETLFLNPKTSSLPSSLELSLMRKFVPLNMRCCSTAFQMKWTSLFRKFFSRVRTALERQVKQPSWKQVLCSESGKCNDTNDVVIQRAGELFCFLKWLSCHLFFSCYPSAPYERKIMAMELILIMIDVWPAIPPPKENNCIYPYNDGFTSPDSTLLLVGSIVDSWDRLRESSYRILLCFPTPLPGISSFDSVKELITWAKKLVCSPRVRESDAGALTLRLVFRKYVLELGWMVGASIDVQCCNPQYDLQMGKSRTPVIEYLLSLIDWLRVVVEEGEMDLTVACKNSFVHGVLLALRYSFEELDWNSKVISSSICEMKHVLEKLLDLIKRITSLALWVVSADAWYLPDGNNDIVDEYDILSQVDFELNASEPSSSTVNGSLKSADNSGPADQFIMVGCWLAMKEVSLLLGTIVRKVPLPRGTYSESANETGDSVREIGDPQTIFTLDAALDLKQLESIGNHFLQVLLKMKHNGAIDKTRAGFTALCNRLLSSNDPRLCKMTESWLEQLMERTIAKGQTVDDLLRRSAGIPAAFIALFLSEPEGTPKKLLPRALRWLIDVANTSMLNLHANSPLNHTMQHKECLRSVDQETEGFMVTVTDASGRTSKVRVEGLVPVVHSFNILKAAFNDTNLATDASGFCAEALIISIRSFSSQHWEVRNSACLAYTALVRRMIGFLNVHKHESAKRVLTGLEFFHRYPALHPFLFDELNIATESLQDENDKHSGSNIAKAIHPSLCPILILLSRLKPSLVGSDTNDAFDPFLFMPFIRRCATQSNLRVRVLASRALTGLVSNERLLNVLIMIANSLPHERRQKDIPISFQPIMIAINGRNEDGAVATSFTSFNTIHGLLIQLCMLIDTNCRNLIDVSKKDQILSELFPVLLKCSWIGNKKLCPCPTLNSSFLQVLDHMLDVARTCKLGKCMIDIQNLLEELSSQCLHSRNSLAFPTHDPTETELCKQSAISYFRSVFGGDEDLEKTLEQSSSPHDSILQKLPEAKISVVELQKRLTLCVSHSKYEVRLATLKWILQFLKSMKSTQGTGTIFLWAKTNLQSTLMQMLTTEEHHKCICYILRNIFMWNILQYERHKDVHLKDIIYIGIMDCDSVASFYNKLVILKSSMMHSKTQEALVCCMGICVKQYAQFLRNSIFSDQSHTGKSTTTTFIKPVQRERLAEIYGYIDDFISLIKKHSAPSEPVNLRKAAAEAIAASGLLEESDFIALRVSNCDIPSDQQDISELNENNCQFLVPSKVINLYGLKILDAWSTCIHMLEDEDVGLRQKLAKDVQNYIKMSCQINCIEVVPTQVERVIESCFEFLSSILGHWIEYFDYLSRWTLETAGYVTAHGDLVRQVFDKEIDNHHEEKLLICQICCLQLEKILKSPSWEVFCSEDSNKYGAVLYIQRWLSKFLKQVIYSASEYREAGGRADWIGGIGNHKDTFIAVYGNLLSLYALLQCPDDTFYLSFGSGYVYSLLSDLDKFKVVIRPFLRNPLVYNLYTLVMRAYEKIILPSHHDLMPSRECSDWKDFDPYFLLR